MSASAALALSLLLAGQTAPPPPTLDLGQAPAQDESAVVAELTVVAKPPGPAVWLVEKDGARLYILGSARPCPIS